MWVIQPVLALPDQENRAICIHFHHTDHPAHMILTSPVFLHQEALDPIG